MHQDTSLSSSSFLHLLLFQLSNVVKQITTKCSGFRNNIYYLLTVSVGQELGSCLAECFWLGFLLWLQSDVAEAEAI